MRCLPATLAALVLLGSAAAAHELWVVPSLWRAAPGQTVTVTTRRRRRLRGAGEHPHRLQDARDLRGAGAQRGVDGCPRRRVPARLLRDTSRSHQWGNRLFNLGTYLAPGYDGHFGWAAFTYRF